MTDLERSLAAIVTALAPLPDAPVDFMLIPRAVDLDADLVTFERRGDGGTVTLRASRYVARCLRNNVGRVLRTRVSAGRVASYYDPRNGRVE